MYLVFDVGGTFIKYALMDKDGEIGETDKFPTQLDNTCGLELLVNSIFEIYTKYKAKNIEGIAMSLPGLIDVQNGFVHNGGALKFLVGVPLGRLVSEKCDNIPVALENDGKCAALCESWKGNASDVRDAYVLVLGTGVGGGMIINHHVHHGNSLIAGEVSYTLHNMDRAQVETITPIETIDEVGHTIDIIPYIAGSCCSTLGLRCKVAKYKGLSYHDVKGEDIFKWASDGDTGVQNILEDWYFTIAKLCVNIYVIFNPEIILIGGGISVQPLVLEGICRYVDKLRNISKILTDIKIGTCKYNNRSNLYGAMMNYNQLFNE
ncbi:MAG: ROK family protein [Lachnospiraceae bacterium]|nr:ROK family protein [Lachnospiraceae bacterium]